MRYEERSIGEVRAILCSYFPEPTLGETLYGMCARFHHLSANRRPALTGALLFGAERASKKHCVPVGLRTFVTTLGNVFASPPEVLRRHTLAALYFRFMTCTGVNEAIAACCAPSGLRRRYQFGWGSAAFDVQHPLRACDECCVEDLSLQGAPTWRLRHQLPGTWVCVIHGRPLMRATPREASSSRWLLPNYCSKEVPSECASVSSEGWDFLAALARAVEQLAGDRPACVFH